MGPDNTTRTFRQDLDRHHAAVNVTAQLGSPLAHEGRLQHGPADAEGTAPRAGRHEQPGGRLLDREINPNYSASAGVDFTPSSRWYISMRTGYFFKDLYNQGVYR